MRARLFKFCTVFTLIGLLTPGLSGCRQNEVRADQNGFGPGCVMLPVEYCVPVERQYKNAESYNGNHRDLKRMVKGEPVDYPSDRTANGADIKGMIKSEPIAYPSDAPATNNLKRMIKGKPATYPDYEKLPPPAVKSEFRKSNVKETYNKARAIMRRGDFVGAAEMFDRIATGAPSHKLAPNALYWQGECYYARGLYQEAINYFALVLGRYPDSPKAPDAQLKVVYSYNAMGDGLTAMANLKGLLEYYPDSKAAEKVRSGKTVFKNPK